MINIQLGKDHHLTLCPLPFCFPHHLTNTHVCLALLSLPSVSTPTSLPLFTPRQPVKLKHASAAAVAPALSHVLQKLRASQISESVLLTVGESFLSLTWNQCGDQLAVNAHSRTKWILQARLLRGEQTGAAFLALKREHRMWWGNETWCVEESVNEQGDGEGLTLIYRSVLFWTELLRIGQADAFAQSEDNNFAFLWR